MKLKLLIAAALTLLLSTVHAQCPTSTIPSGTGTLSDPYQIATFSNLRWLSETPSAWAAGTYFIQTANIDASCTSDPSYNAGAGFSPIGLAVTQFQGNYDGQGYFISNIFINISVCYVGVFGYANNAQITNLNIQNCNITSTCRVGGLVGQGNTLTISNCNVTGTISCGSSGYVGGLAAIISTGNITNCSANVQVSTTQNYAGCLIGWANACTITNCWSGGSASASDMVGGFIGQLSSSLSLVSSCYTTASATITATYFRVGGFVGRVQNGRITKSYASGHVTGILSSGGFVSIIEAGCTVDSCYFNGQVSGGANGFCYFNSGTINSCYWDIDASGVTVSNGGIGLTTCQMKTTGTFESDGWRFPAVWTQNSTNNNGYPALAWQGFTHSAVDTLDITGASQINTTCSSTSNGSATVTLTGGTGTRTYSWSPSGGSSSTASNLTTGSYTVTVTDANTCSVSQTFSIVNGDSIPPQLYYITCSSNSNASGTAYSDGWQNGDNDGSGFNAWTLNASTGNTSQAGFLRGSSITNGAGVDNNGDGDINSGGFALGLYANSAQATEAIRPFPTALAANSILQIEFDNGNVAPGQIVGFQLQNSSGNSLGEVRYRGGQATYEIVDANGITPFSSIPFTDEGIIISVKSISTGIVQITLTRKLDGVSQTLTSNLFPGGGNQLIRRFKVFNSNAGSGLSNTLFVNNFSICSVTNGCPSNVSAFSSSGTCNATVTFPSIAAVDNCDGNVSVIQTSGLPSSSSFPAGTTINTFSATDGNGNTSTCSFNVIVQDTVRPTANCQNLTLHLNTSGNASLILAMVNNGSSDACGIASMSVSPNSFSCANVGSNTVTLTVTDVSGNSSTCTSIVTVVDTVRPVVNTQNLTLQLNAAGTASIIPAMVNNGSTDACGIASMSVSPNSFSCANIGANTVTLTVTDVNGNSRTGTAIVTVADTVRPVAIAQNVTVTLSGGTATVNAAAVNNGSTDACGIGTLSVSPNTFTCANLGPNTVTLTVTDVNGNSSTTTAIVTVLSNLTAAMSVNNNVSCFGGGNGQAVITPSGGAGPFTYSWTPSGGTGSTSTGLIAGTYTCAVTDAGGCTTSQTVNITQPTQVVAASSAGSILCNGGTTAVTVSSSGGISPYFGTGTFTETAGTHSYTVTDANGCTSSTSITITEPTLLVANSSATSILCNGGNATVTVGATGGTMSYSGTGTFTVTAGTYSYTVTDANGCTSTTSIAITEPSALSATSSATSITCNGGNATVTVVGSGGTLPYTGEGAFTVTAGTYSYTVTDVNGCTVTTSITVTEPSALSAASSASTLLCNGDTSTVTVTASGGFSPYTGAGTYSEVAGTYTYTVTDNNGCTTTTTVTITEPTAISTVVASTNVLCNGDSTGSIDLTVTGGTAPYTFNWNSGQYTTEDLTNIPAGSYSGVLTDANGCTDGGTVVINEPSVLAATAVITNPTGCTTNDGSIDLSVAGGTPGYAYVWSTTATTEDVTALDGGNYSVSVTDTNGCVATASFTLTEPGVPTVTFAAGLDTVCQSTTAPFTLTGASPAGGVFSGTGMINDTVFDPMTAGLGFNVITYTYTDSLGCTGSAVDSILVDVCTGTALNMGTSPFTIFPNPNNGAFTVITTTYSDMMIYDAQGKLVAAQKVQANVQNQINIESSGMYMITIVAADGSRTTQRVVVTK